LASHACLPLIGTNFNRYRVSQLFDTFRAAALASA
jgi:hypothetical protein